MSQPPPQQTPSQTVGPYLSIALVWPDGPWALPAGTPGGIWLRGRLVDGAGAAVSDGLVESWQADPEGRFDHPDDPRGAVRRSDGFRGFGRCPTDTDGQWAIYTLKPGQLADADGRPQAPHVDLSVFARGLLDRVVSRLYFADEPAANAADPVLSDLDEPARLSLLAQPTDDGYRMDIVLQGPRQTVFFAL